MLSSVGVYCASSRGADPGYATAAASLGQLLAGREIRLVYGGAHVGLMGVLADAALACGGQVHGVITQALHHQRDRAQGRSSEYDAESLTRFPEQFVAQRKPEVHLVVSTRPDR